MSGIRAALFVLMLASTTAFAQPARNAAERSQDHREQRTDGREMSDDMHDLQRMTDILQRFDHARALHAVAALDGVDRELRVYLNSELVEGRREVSQDRAEVAQSTSEVRSDRRERGRNAAQPTAPGARANDRHDQRDDRRDLADDKQDLAAEQRQQARKREISGQLNGLYGRHDPNSLALKRGLIVELWQLAQMEVRQDAVETREDHGEMREDRRETREDRR